MSNWMMEALGALNDAAAGIGGRVEKRRDDALHQVAGWLGELAEWIDPDAPVPAGTEAGSAAAATAEAARVLGDTSEGLGLPPEAADIDPRNPPSLVPPLADVALQPGDNDASMVWGGTKHLVSGNHVKTLQQRLVELGYWVSKPESESGMNCDGDYGVSTTGAVAAFQLEHGGVGEDGSIDLAKVTGVFDQATRAALAAATGRPSHVAALAGEGVRFVQLPPRTHYGRYGVQYDLTRNDNGALAHPILPASARQRFRIPSDNWGSEAMIGLLDRVGRRWVEEKRYSIFLIGDISRFAGGEMPPHKTHRVGTGVDVSGIHCNVGAESFDPVRSLELANLFVEEDADTVIYFGCHHVLSHQSRAGYVRGHHNHFHVDIGAGAPSRQFTSCAECMVYSRCAKRITKVAKRGSDGGVTEEAYRPQVHSSRTYTVRLRGGGSEVRNDLCVYRRASEAPTGKWYVSETASG